MKRVPALAIGLCAIFVSPAHAERQIGGVTDVTPIVNESAEGRILLRLELPAFPENVAIRRAILFFDVPADVENRSLPLRVHPVTTSWNPSTADWTSGWTRPGGDFPEDLFARAELESGREAGTGIIDLTALVKEVVEDGFEADGLLVTLDPNFGAGIREADLGLFASLSAGRLEISSRIAPPIPQSVVEARE